METEHITGNYCARRTINNIIQTTSESHYLSLETFVTQAIEQKWLLVLVIDDYTSVHTKWRPLDEKPSEAKTMCTIVVKAFKDTPAISIDHASTVHNINEIDIESCKGIITSASMTLPKLMLHQCPIGFLKHFLIQNFNGKESIPISTVKVIMSEQ